MVMSSGAVACLKSRSKVQAGKKTLVFIIKLIIKRRKKSKKPSSFVGQGTAVAFRGEQNDSFVFA